MLLRRLYSSRLGFPRFPSWCSFGLRFYLGKRSRSKIWKPIHLPTANFVWVMLSPAVTWRFNLKNMLGDKTRLFQSVTWQGWLNPFGETELLRRSTGRSIGGMWHLHRESAARGVGKTYLIYGWFLCDPYEYTPLEGVGVTLCHGHFFPKHCTVRAGFSMLS